MRGHEGAAARAHFDGLNELLPPDWRFEGRSRNPPRDPVNALLSYGYGVLYHSMHTLVCRCGLDPHVGCLHAEREGHAGLVSDLIEEFRAPVVDSTVLRLLLQGRLRIGDFELGELGQADYPVRLSTELRRRFVAELDRKFNSPLSHPSAARPLDYRRAMLWQASHWADVVVGNAETYRPLVLR